MYEARQNKEIPSRVIGSLKEKGIQRNWIGSWNRNCYVKCSVIQKSKFHTENLKHVQISNYISSDKTTDTIIDNILKVEYCHEKRMEFIDKVSNFIDWEIKENSPQEIFFYGYFAKMMGAGACDEISSIVFTELCLQKNINKAVYKCHINRHAFNIVYDKKVDSICEMDEKEAMVIDVWSNQDDVKLADFLNGENCFRSQIDKKSINIDTCVEKYIFNSDGKEKLEEIINKYVKEYEIWKNGNKENIMKSIDFKLLYFDDNIDSFINVISIIKQETGDDKKVYDFILNRCILKSLDDWIALYNCCALLYDACFVRIMIKEALETKEVKQYIYNGMIDILNNVGESFFPKIEHK